MATLEELMAERQRTSLAAPQIAPLPKTLLESKKERLFGGSGNAPQPQESEEGSPRPSYGDLLGGVGGSSTPSSANRAGSSLYKAGGSLADMGKSISNSVLGTEFDDSVETGWSRPADPETRQASEADRLAGISFDQRQNANQELQGVMDTYVQDGLVPALWEAIPQAPGVIADSTASFVEGAAGAAATALGGSGAALLAKKAKNTFDVISKIGDSYDKAKEANRAIKAAETLAKTVTKRSSQASVITADIVQQTKAEYEQETGEKMSPERLAGTTLLNLATAAWQPAIFSKFYLPRSKNFVGKNLRQKFVNEQKQMAKYLDKGAVKAVADRVGAGIGKVLQASGAEAAQEYAQTWAGILSVNMNPDEAGGLIASAFKEFGDADNQDEAAVAGILGSVAGGGIRAASAVPTTAAMSASDVAFKAGQGIANKSYNSARDRLSSEDQQSDVEERGNLRAASKEIQDEAKRKVDIIANVEGFNDISDEAVKADMTAVAKGRDLSDPKVYDAVANKVVRSYNADSLKAMSVEKAQNAKISGRKVVKKVVDGTKDVLDLTPEEVQNIKDYTTNKAESVKGMGKAFIDDVKNYKTSATVGVAEAAVSFMAEATGKATSKGIQYVNDKESVKKLKAKLDKNDSVESARTLANSLETNSPDNSKNVVREIRRWADQKEKDKKTVGRTSDTFLNSDNLGNNIKEASQEGATVTNPRALSIELTEAVKGSVEDSETLQSIENALDNYEKTDFSKSDAEGVLSPAKLKNIRKKITTEREAIKERGDTPVEGRTSDTLLNFNNLGDNIKGASQKGQTVANPKALSNELSEAVKGSIEDVETLQSIENALDNYEQTDFAKSGTEGTLSPAKLKNIRRKLVAERDAIKERGDNSVVGRTKAAAKSVSEAATKATDWAQPAVDSLKKAGITTVDALVDKVTNEDVFISEDTKTQRATISGIRGYIKKKILDSEEGADLDPEALLEAKVAMILADDENSVFNDDTIKDLSKAFNTSNPDYLMSVMERIFSPVREPAAEKILRDRMARVLEDSEYPNTKPTRQRKQSKKPVDENTDNDQNSSEVDNNSKVVVEEEGAVFRAAPDLEKVRSKLEEILGNHICKA